MTEGNNPALVGRFVQSLPDSLVDLATDMVTDPKVKHPLTRDQSHGDALANDTHLFNVINPNRSTVLHCEPPVFCTCERGAESLAEPLTSGVKVMTIPERMMR